jgi:ketosteroid isomerase-like protein
VRRLAEQHCAGGRTEDVRIERREIQVAGDSAYELAWYSESSRRQEEAFRMQARHFILWKREGDNSWRVQRYLYNVSGAEPLP